MDKLKPCPFCGGKPVIQYNNILSGWWSVRCSNQFCRVICFTDDCDTKNGAIEAWNTRKGENQIENNIQAVAEVLGLNKGEENG